MQLLFRFSLTVTLPKSKNHQEKHYYNHLETYSAVTAD